MGTAMNHVAIDLGSKQSQLCVRSADGTIQREEKLPNARLEKALQALGPSRVVLEASAEAFAVAELALAAGHKVNIVPAGLARNLGVGQRGVKNDKKDAQSLSLASCRMETLPNVHLPSKRSQELRSLLTSRAQLVESRTAMVNCIRGWLRTQLLRLPTGGRTSFVARVRELLMARPEGMPVHIERLAQVIEVLDEQLKAANKELEDIADADSVVTRLRTVPGVGPLTAVTFVATLDDITRFKSAHAVESYVGLTPGENSSGETSQRLGITKAGSPRVRKAMIQAAWSAWNHRKADPMVSWALRMEERRPRQVAITALARKMVGILFALWRDGSSYEPQRGARTPTVSPPTQSAA